MPENESISISDLCLCIGNDHNSHDDPIPFDNASLEIESNATNMMDLYPEIWAIIFEYCPLSVINEISDSNPYFENLISNFDHTLATKKMSSEMIG